MPLFLLVMAVSIVCYVAAEAGVSDWLVRYLAALPLSQASLALTLFWGGIACGRLVFARIGNRLDPQRSAAALAVAGGALLTVALAGAGLGRVAAAVRGGGARVRARSFRWSSPPPGRACRASRRR